MSSAKQQAVNSSFVDRLHERKIGRLNETAFLLCAALLIAVTVLHIAVARGVFADGAYFLFQMLTRQDFWLYDNVRAFAQYVYQSPVIAAINAGITNTKHLARIYTLALE